MKKVLHVSYSLDTGGGPLYISKIVDEIRTVTHYVTGNKGYYFSSFETRLGPGKVFELNDKSVIANVKIIRRICEENGITIIHAHGRGAGLYARLLKFFGAKVKVIYTIHGFHPDTLNPLLKFTYILVEKFLYSFTDIVISVSKSECQRFMDTIKPRDVKKMVYIPNYISAEDIKPPLVKIDLDRDFVNLIYIGRLSWEKGIDVLLDAWQMVREEKAKLHIVGYGPDERLVRAQVDGKNLIFLGKIENASSILPFFDAVIIPSRFEGMPFIGLEAMIQKSAVICTPSVGLTDLFDKSSSYMSDDFSPKFLGRTIEKFINDFRKNPAEIKNRVDRSFNRVRGEFSKDSLKRIEEIYARIGE
jgi:glycosyltransferase involved in cell wall biosynthesis